MPLRGPLRKLRPGIVHYLPIARQVREPESMDAGTPGMQTLRIQSRGLARGVAVSNDASKIAQAADALGHVLTAQHLKRDVHAFTIGQVLDCLLIVLLLVVNRMLKAKFLHASQLFVR